MPHVRPADRSGPLWLERALIWGAIAAAATIVYHGALGYFFSQDDFGGLARAAGLLPRLDGPWRYLSGQAYFDLMRAVAGLDPLPYHLASLVAHLTCAVLVWTLLSRRLSTPAAWLGAVFFAVHPALFTAIYSISGIGEILAIAFGLGTLLAIEHRGRLRWLALPLFMLSLISKESTVLLPAVALAMGRRGADESSPAGGGSLWRSRLKDPVILGLIAISILYVTSFVARDAFGVRHPLPEHEPYALGFDLTLGTNLLTYLGWTATFLLPMVRSFMDAVEPRVFVSGVLLALLWLAGTLRRDLRERGWVAAGALYLLLLLPVLPLRNHTYHYYLYGPLVGAAWCLAAVMDLFVTRPKPQAQASRARGRPRAAATTERSSAAAWTVAGALAIALTLNGSLLVRKIETYPFLLPELRADPIVDRARIAANVYADLRHSALPSRLLFWSPASIELQRSVGRSPESESYFERNVRSALMDGLAVRVLFPQVREVGFVRDFRAVDNSENYALYGPDGHLRLMSKTERDSLMRARSLSNGR